MISCFWVAPIEIRILNVNINNMNNKSSKTNITTPKTHITPKSHQPKADQITKAHREILSCIAFSDPKQNPSKKCFGSDIAKKVEFNKEIDEAEKVMQHFRSQFEDEGMVYDAAKDFFYFKTIFNTECTEEHKNSFRAEFKEHLNNYFDKLIEPPPYVHFFYRPIEDIKQSPFAHKILRDDLL